MNSLQTFLGLLNNNCHCGKSAVKYSFVEKDLNMKRKGHYLGNQLTLKCGLYVKCYGLFEEKWIPLEGVQIVTGEGQ